MEESSLDDFFAKKDKSKKKKGSKSVTAGDILDGAKPKKSGKKKKDKEKTNQSSAGATEKPPQEDDEWKDFQEEEEKDFSDLKIANLQISSRDVEDDSERAGEGSGDDDVDGEGRDRKDGASGPWNKASGPVEPTVEPEPVPAKPPTPPPEAPKTTGKYVPPGRRAAMDTTSSSTPSALPRGYGRKKKEAPDVMSELDFPSLGGAPAHSQGGDSGRQQTSPGKFEQVRGGGRQVEDPRLQTGKVEIGNKFDALASED